MGDVHPTREPALWDPPLPGLLQNVPQVSASGELCGMRNRQWDLQLMNPETQPQRWGLLDTAMQVHTR